MDTPQVLKRTIGAWTVHAIQAGALKLDGGAMFGVVPTPLWEKRLPADDRNRIPMGMRCLLVEHDVGLVLIDTGAGNKENARFYEIYGIDNRGTTGPTALEDGIRAAGHAPEDVSIVINTHLHFDHAGGNTYRDESGAIRPSMPNARYVVQRGELLRAQLRAVAGCGPPGPGGRRTRDRPRHHRAADAGPRPVSPVGAAPLEGRHGAVSGR